MAVAVHSRVDWLQIRVYVRDEICSFIYSDPKIPLKCLLKQTRRTPLYRNHNIFDSTWEEDSITNEYMKKSSSYNSSEPPLELPPKIFRMPSLCSSVKESGKSTSKVIYKSPNPFPLLRGIPLPVTRITWSHSVTPPTLTLNLCPSKWVNSWLNPVCVCVWDGKRAKRDMI